MSEHHPSNIIINNHQSALDGVEVTTEMLAPHICDVEYGGDDDCDDDESPPAPVVDIATKVGGSLPPPPPVTNVVSAAPTTSITSSRSKIEENPWDTRYGTVATDTEYPPGTEDPNIDKGDVDKASVIGSDTSSIDTPTHESRCRRWLRTVWTFYMDYQFPCHIVLAIALARAYPPLGAEYLKPKITASALAVAIIFFVSGVGLRTEQLVNALKYVYFNTTVQVFNFFAVSAVTFSISRLLVVTNILSEPMADGLTICGCLSVSVNAAIMLTIAASGNQAAAVLHAAVGNVIGIFLSPVLILGYLGKTGDVSLGEIFLYLTYRVIIPLIIGQIVQRLFVVVRDFSNNHKKALKKIQETALAYIVYTVFCKTFKSDTRAGIGNCMILLLMELILMIFFLKVSWELLRIFFRDEPELRVAGLFNCVSKTIALGVPLINSMYEDDPNIALYTLPILIWHPMFLVVGSVLVPKLTIFVDSERCRLDSEQLEQAKPTQDNDAVEDVEAAMEDAVKS
jgi:solute carrier family 10 (sodium/bile acid cotransporter), member 7